MLGAVRVVVAALAAGVALLVVLPAPRYVLWELSVPATEWGYWMALVSLAVLLPGARRGWTGVALAAVGVLSAAALLWPLARAVPIARALPGRMDAAFGAVPPRTGPDAPARASALSAVDLLRGVRSPMGSMARAVYAVRDGRPLRVDLYLPAGRTPAPCVVLVHGGSWRGGDRTELPALDRYLAARGYAVASVDYRLAPGHTWPAARQDVLAAVAWVKAHAATFGVDPRRIVLLGRSAGGQLALQAALTAHDPDVRGVVSLYGPTDLPWGWDHPSNPAVLDSRGALRDYLGGTPATARAAFLAASPVTAAGAGSPPVLMIHGGKDELVSIHHSELLDAALARAGRPHLLLRLPWATHGCDFAFNGPCGQLSTFAVERFLAAFTR